MANDHGSLKSWTPVLAVLGTGLVAATHPVTVIVAMMATLLVGVVLHAVEGAKRPGWWSRSIGGPGLAARLGLRGDLSKSSQNAGDGHPLAGSFHHLRTRFGS